jgi:hypothetical protein
MIRCLYGDTEIIRGEVIVAGYTLKDQVRNDNIREQLGIFNANDRIQQNKKNRYEHILRMDPRRITEQILQYKPIGY